MRFNLGCGPKKLEGWMNIDSVKSFNPDLVHDISLPFPYADESVDEILADSLLEHFDKYLRFIVFYEWARMLKIGGIITITVPNFPKIIRRYFKFNFSIFLDSIFGEVMLGGEEYIGHFGVHKYGYSEKTLKAFVREFGIETIRVYKKHLNIILVGRKITNTNKEAIERIKIYYRYAMSL
jgi:ubiquinone/menaquinone biosynthesis C-methylase UbiE